MPDAGAPAVRREVALCHVVAAVCGPYVSRGEPFCAPGHRGNRARAAALYPCKRLTGLWLSDLGQGFGGVGPSAICNRVSAVKRRLQREGQLA